MSSYSKINKVIQNKLNSKRKILSRQGSSDIFSPSDKDSRKQHQQNVIKTPYIIMVSTDKLQDKESNEIGSDDFFMLSNQEYSKNNKNINVGTNLYNARSLSDKTEVPYRPAPGIKDLTSEFVSTNNTQFNRQVTVNFTCYSLVDLEELNERFMSLERKVYVQWGWATDEKITPLIKPDGKINYSGSDPENKKSEITRLQEEVITKGQGDFDAVIGFVKQISFSLREDGGFDCTTELLAQGINIMDTPLQQGGEGNQDVISKGLQYGNYSAQFGSFINEVNNLQNDAVEIVGVETERNIYQGKFSAESVETTTDDNEKIKEVQFKNVTQEGKSFVYNENFILTKTYKQTASTFNPDLDVVNNRFSGNYIDAGKVASRGDLSFNEYSKQYIKPTLDPNECWVRWGWFEDNLLNKYFALYDHTDEPVSYYRSIQETGTLKKALEGEVTDTILETTTTTSYNRGFEVTNTRTREVEESRTVSSSIDFESAKVKNQKDFITTDIKQFLFPGKFSIEKTARSNALQTLEKKYNEMRDKDTELRKDPKFNEKIQNENSPEYKLYNEINDFIEQYDTLERDAIQQDENLKQFQNIKKLKETIYDSGFSLNNLDEVTETGFDKYLFLYELSEILKDRTTIKYFGVENENEKGYLRNIFINIGHLQSIFGDTNATTLGETMNILFSSLAGNTVNEIDLITRYNTENGDGRYGAEPRKPTENPDYPVNYDKDSAKGDIYEFPVHQQDSIVLSQEISTDLTNTQMQVLMSKNLSAQVKKQLDKKGISPEHVVNFTETNAQGNKIPKSEYQKSAGLQPAFVKYGLKYGNPLGANEDWPIKFWAGSVPKDDSSGKKQIDDATIKQNIEKANSQTEKDLELASNRFTELPIAYTIDGKLKSDIFKNMTDKLQVEVEEQTDEDGNAKVVTFPKVSDFGLIGLTTTLTLTGIAGIYPSNVFTTTYLPTKFKINDVGGSSNGEANSSCHFWTTGVTQNCSAESWTTQLEARMAWRFLKDE